MPVSLSHPLSFQMDKIVDTTGAGDAFSGAFLVALLEGWDLMKAARFANAAAALKTLGRGAVTPLPTRKEVEKFLSSVGGLRRP